MLVPFLNKIFLRHNLSQQEEQNVLVFSGSCQASRQYEAMITKISRKITEKRKHSSLLSSLRSEQHRIPSKSKSSEATSHQNRAKNFEETSKTQLPTINKARIHWCHKAMMKISTQSKSEYKHRNNNFHFMFQTPKKSIKKTKQETQTSIDNPVHYAKIDLVTERECFVSNGAECVLISKQFLKENMDTETKRRLQSKIAPYPNLVQIRNAVDDKLAWKSYRDQVLYDTVR
ncbi:Hypothetical predicted protein [Mytilus galloprovincialis]|uniref:Uncharacterized protein n=1 Tax=Mytilus galloprovincialis TaxID=29158 RepID=A0A8B6DFT1_MYTGA|nr:Hypothetical predicted protein [Mytilus galloprovincialis]